jgi:hypothetical protein
VFELHRPDEAPEDVDVVHREIEDDVVPGQDRIGISADSRERKVDRRSEKAFLHDLPERMISHGLLVLCGESGIVKQNRSGAFTDNLKFLAQLDRLNVLTAIALRLDGPQSAMLAELRTTHNQIARSARPDS